MAVGPGVDVAVSSPTPIGHMDRVGWAGVAYSPTAPGWLVGVWTPWPGRCPGTSNDGSKWATLKEHKGDQTLPDQGWCVGHWAVEGIEQEYRHFRIIQTGKSRGKNSYHSDRLYSRCTGSCGGAAW